MMINWNLYIFYLDFLLNLQVIYKYALVPNWEELKVS